MATIDTTTDPLTAVRFALGGGIFRVRLDVGRTQPGARSGKVLDDAGEVIGSASDYIYGGRGFAVSTRAFGGFVPLAQIEFVKRTRTRKVAA